MKTIKSFTSLEQSKKLAEILQLESADMFHFIHEVDTVGFGYKKEAAEFYSKTEFEYLPCWSLASLLDILPEIQGGKPIIDLDDNYITYPHMSDLHTKADNLIDACVAMIEKLYELKML